jgi:hypothetical protein
MSNLKDGRIITAFNAHPDGVDKRTNLYFLQTDDMGATWQTIDGLTVTTPLDNLDNPAIVRNYQAEKRLVYLKDIQFDRDNHPVLLYITSAYHQPGPVGEPRWWTIAQWTGSSWQFHKITRATHNYDMGSLYIERGIWRLIAPTEPGPQHWGAGGEMAMWLSGDQGATWRKEHVLTHDSQLNHAYARRAVHAHPDFYAFWADGHADEFSPSRLYFSDKTGKIVRQLPDNMQRDFAKPQKVETPR